MKSNLATKEILSPHYNERKSPVIKYTVHHAATVASAENVAKVFQNPSRQASSNYVIGGDGTVVLSVPEEFRAWTSGNEENDTQAITVEVCNATGAPEWTVSDAALRAVIDLGVDLCRRYGLPGFTWTGDKNGTLTIHKMFAATACPGPYLERKMPYIAEEIRKRVQGENEVNKMLYKVQVGAFSKKENAEKLLLELKEKGYDGLIVQVDDSSSAPPSIGAGSLVKVKAGAKTYDGKALASFVYTRNHVVKELKGDRAVITFGGVVVAAVKVSDLTLL